MNTCKPLDRQGLLIVMPNLAAGGAERIQVAIANHLARQQPVYVATIREHGSLRSTLAPGVRVISLHGRLLWLPNLVFTAWKLRPSTILSSAFDLNFLILAVSPLLPRDTGLVVREAALPYQVLPPNRLGRTLLATYYKLYRKATQIVLLSQHMAHKTVESAPHGESKIRVIPNAPDPLRLPPVRTFTPAMAPPYFVAIGRLAPQKGFEVLIQAFAKYSDDGGKGRLDIFGTGPEKEALEHQIQALGLTGKVSLAGHLEDMHKLARADGYILSSRFEGLANTLLEALHMGLPVLATSNETSADEFMTDGIDGVLVPQCDVATLAQGLCKFSQLLATFDRAAIAARANRKCNRQSMLDSYKSLLTSQRS